MIGAQPRSPPARLTCLTLIIRLDRWLVWDGRWASLRILILGSGMTVTRLAGRWPRVPQAPGVLLPWSWGWLRSGQGACGRALRRVQAVTIAVAQGQVLEIFS